MKKVFQTIVDKGNGNCMQATVASLLDLNLEDVPNFIEYQNSKQTNPYRELLYFLRDHGYSFGIIDHKYEIGSNKFKTRMTLKRLREITRIDGGINGYFYGSVKSQTFDNAYHAVVVDKDLNIVHDPNPNQLALKLKPKDVISIITNRDNWDIDIDGKIVIENND